MTKAEMRQVMDRENGAGFSNNFNLNGYVFQRKGTFVVFELRTMEGIKICHIKYIHVERKEDLLPVMAYCCNFWMGNRVQFIFYREKERKNGAFEFLKGLGFRDEVNPHHQWKWAFQCVDCHQKKCVCAVHNMFK